MPDTTLLDIPQAEQDQMLAALRRARYGYLLALYVLQQVPRSLRRNRLPTKRINGALVMRHEHPAGALVELVKIAKTSSSTHGILHHSPKAFDRVEVMATMGG